MQKQDITNRDDVVRMIDIFYAKSRENKTIGYIFNDVAKVNWEHHLQVMYSFWADMLLDERSYFGNPMQKHIQLSKITPLTEVEFSEWLRLFTQTVDELFTGEKAQDAKMRASNIARMMLQKITATSGC